MESGQASLAGDRAPGVLVRTCLRSPQPFRGRKDVNVCQPQGTKNRKSRQEAAEKRRPWFQGRCSGSGLFRYALGNFGQAGLKSYHPPRVNVRMNREYRLELRHRVSAQQTAARNTWVCVRLPLCTHTHTQVAFCDPHGKHETEVMLLLATKPRVPRPTCLSQRCDGNSAFMALGPWETIGFLTTGKLQSGSYHRITTVP